MPSRQDVDGRDVKRRLAAGALLLVAAGCGDAARDETLVVRSSLPKALLDYAEAAFEGQHPAVDVRFVESADAETLEVLRSGRADADVWWGAPAPLLATAADEGLLQPYRASWAAQSDFGGGDDEGRWSLSSVSPLVIAFNRERTELARAPRDWVDLFHFRWVGEVVLADPVRNSDSAHFLAAMLVEALRDDEDLGRGFDWLLRLDGAVGEYVADHDQAIRRLSGEGARVAILPRHVAEAARHDRAPWLHYRLPESGSPLLSRGIAIAAGTSRPELARAFVELTGTTDMATEARLRTRWVPVQEELERSRFPPDFELEMPWAGYPLAPDTIASELASWVERWNREVRGRGRR